MQRAMNWWMLKSLTVMMTVAEAAAEDAGRRIVVSIPDHKLALIENGTVVRMYPVAVGAPVSPSPTGDFTIITRVPNPTYYKPGHVIPAGKANPLGTRWIGLSLQGYGIHGTNVPRSIGKNASHGCIRMRNQDVEDLFELVHTGDAVELHGDRTAELARIFDAESPTATIAAAPSGQE